MRAVILAFLLATPALAEPSAGLDDPDFRAPFDRALQGNDPSALVDLHAAAEAGNVAAILALPTVLQWMPPTGTLAERKRFRMIGGLPMVKAVAATDPVAALWAMGDTDTDMNALLDRAFALYAAGEADKATSLFLTWVNQTGGYGDLPPGFFDQPVPPWAMSILLRGRLNDPFKTTVEAVDDLVADRLRADDPAAWIALAGYAGLHRPDAPPADTARLARIFKAAAIPQDVAARRMLEGAAILKVTPPDPFLDVATVTAATTTFLTEPEFQPVLALCSALCPETADACATAFVAGFGPPFGRTATVQPFTSLISTKDFFATARGRMVLLGSVRGFVGDDPASSVFLKAARRIDACLADAVLAEAP